MREASASPSHRPNAAAILTKRTRLSLRHFLSTIGRFGQRGCVPTTPSARRAEGAFEKYGFDVSRDILGRRDETSRRLYLGPAPVVLHGGKRGDAVGMESRKADKEKKEKCEDEG